ncbi:MAG: glycoside hydrolase family 55 protein [Thermoleophilia bacterium]|nr:glycoside hydrolase family 55 protein [Thermoleophilia bacterium]
MPKAPPQPHVRRNAIAVLAVIATLVTYSCDRPAGPAAVETAGPGLSTSVSEAPGGAAPTSTDVHVTPADLTAMVGALLQLPPSPAGSPEGPGGDLTGAECLALLVEATDLSHAGLLREPYQGWVGTLASDDPALRDAVRRAEFSGLLRGLDLRDFDPDRPASRTQVSRIVGNLRAKLTPLDATRFGAAGDGRTNDREAIQAALDAASAEGAPLYFPPGIYKIEFTQSDDHLTYEGDVSLIGAGRDSTVLDVHPKTVGDFGYRLLATKAPDSRLSLAELTLAGPSGSRADHPDEQEETVAVWAAPSSPLRVRQPDLPRRCGHYRQVFPRHLRGRGRRYPSGA